MAGGENGESLRDLALRLIDGVKDYVRAEIAVVKQTALEWSKRATPAIAGIIVAILIVQAALTVLVASLGLALAHWLGAAGGLAIAGVLALVIAGLLVWFAVSRLNGKAG